VLDYPARRLTVARPGALAHAGTAVPCRVNRETGLFMVDATIDGTTVPLGVDTGSAGTWVSDRLTAAWLVRHPDWPRAVGAAGSTNFFGFPFESGGTLVALPSLAIGGVEVDRETAVLGLDQGLFDWYSTKSAAAVAGFLGADLLARFRLEIDFPAQTTWWQAGPQRASRDLDIVPVTLRPEAGGGFAVAGLVARAGQPLAPLAQAGDRLLQVNELTTDGATMGAVVAALRGEPGDERTLTLERNGARFAVKVPVVRLP
jgi:hypothetical protein